MPACCAIVSIGISLLGWLMPSSRAASRIRLALAALSHRRVIIALLIVFGVLVVYASVNLIQLRLLRASAECLARTLSAWTRFALVVLSGPQKTGLRRPVIINRSAED